MGAKKQARTRGFGNLLPPAPPVVHWAEKELRLAEHTVETQARALNIVTGERDAAQKEIDRLRAEVTKQKTDLDALRDERDALKRENGRLKRIVKALKDAFVAATEEDAPSALPFGLSPR